MRTPISVDRVFGSYPMSIATSLAMEGLLHTGEYADWKGKLPIHDYQEIFLNVRTLFRNAFYAFEDNRDRLTPEVIRTCIEEDIAQFTAVASAAAPAMVCVPYLCQYKTVNKEFPLAHFRNALGGEGTMSANQAFYNSVEQDVYRMFLNEETGMENLLAFDNFPKNNKDTLLLTHYPADLIHKNRFPKLGLLESHSGKVKKQMEWYTKLYNKPKQIPFNKAFLVLFGDAYMFSPQDRKIRNVLLKTAEKYHWDQSTTMDRIYNCLKLVNEPHVIDYLRKLSH